MNGFLDRDEASSLSNIANGFLDRDEASSLSTIANGFLDRDELVEPEVVVRVKIANFVSLRPLGNQLVIQTSVGDDINVTFNSTNLRRLVGDCLSELQGYASVGEYALF